MVHRLALLVTALAALVYALFSALTVWTTEIVRTREPLDAPSLLLFFTIASTWMAAELWRAALAPRPAFPAVSRFFRLAGNSWLATMAVSLARWLLGPHGDFGSAGLLGVVGTGLGLITLSLPGLLLLAGARLLERRRGRET